MILSWLQLIWSIFFFPHCDSVPSEHQVWAGGSHRKILQLCVSCISTPPHCLTQLLSFIYCGAVLHACSQLFGVTPQHPASSHTGREWFTSAAPPLLPHTHTHTHATTVPSVSSRCPWTEVCKYSCSLDGASECSSLFFAGQAVPIWICMKLWWACSFCSGADIHWYHW